MSNLNDIVEVIVANTTVAVSRAGFGSLLHVGEFDTSIFADKVRSYGTLEAVAEDFPTAHPVYRAAQGAFSDASDFVPSTFLVGRRTPGTPEEHTLTVTAPTSGDGTITIKVDGQTIAGIDVPAGTTDNDAAVLLEAAIAENTQQPFDSSVATNVVTLVSLFGSNEYDVTAEVTGTGTVVAAANSVTAVASAEAIADCLNDIEAVTPDFFGVTILSTRQTDIEAAAAWLQASSTKRLGGFRGNDPDGTGITDPASTTDVAYNLSNSSYSQSALFAHEKPWLFNDTRIMGGRLGVDPDSNSTTWALYTVAGLPTSKWSDTQIAALKAKKANYYVERGGVGALLEGVAADGEYLDIVVAEAWFQARLAERVFALLSGETNSGSKVPYDDTGAAMLEAELRGQFSDAIGIGHVSASPEPTYDTPARADISSVTAQTREYPQITGVGQWAGAVHRAKFRAVISV